MRSGTEAGPTQEVGAVSSAMLPGWGQLGTVDEREYAPDLRWPASITVYDRMVADAQMDGLLRAVKLPVQRRRWSLNPNGADPVSVSKLAEDLSIPIKGLDGDPAVGPRRDRFSFAAHLRDVLRALEFGHYFFEQVGYIGADGLWHLKKLAARPPRTVGEINVAPDGGLNYIRQSLGIDSPQIPVSRLTCYVWDYEPGNWVGRSMMRSCYRNWLIKDRLLRVDAIKHERSGVGIPIAEAPPGASPDEIQALDAMMRAMKVTETGGGAVPAGAKPQLMGTSGSVPDTIASIRFHNEEMAGAFLAMFKQLGQTQTGSRALGGTFLDFFELGLDAVCDWICDTFNQHVIEDWYDYNYGPEAAVPLLVFDVDDESLGANDLKMLVDGGVVVVDEELEAEIRERYNLPAKSATAPAPPPPSPSPDSLQTGTVAKQNGAAAAASAAEVDSLPLPDRPLRRQPYAHEIAAAVDFASLDAAVSGGTGQLVERVNVLQRAQIDQLHDAIVAAGGDLKKLALINADPVAEAVILESMNKTATVGIEQAILEAKAQGITPAKVSVGDLSAQIESRAAAVDSLLSRSLSEAAARNAIRRTADGVSATEVADAVKAHLSGLTDRYLTDQLGGALNSAMNTGRKAVIHRNNPAHIYSSELLDDATCDNCVSVDGTEYQDIATAESDYPTGGFSDCLGLERCRGTLVAVYGETGATK